MRIVGSNRSSLNPSEKETLALMARRDRHRRPDSPQAGGESEESLEEISADDFKRPDSRDAARSRGVWNYRMPRDYAQRLSSFAWAQAVQNKPLGLDLMPMAGGDLAKGEDVCYEGEDEEMVIDVSSQEKEDGEIEEGEIESGSEMEPSGKKEVDSGASVAELVEDGLDKRELVETESDKKELIEIETEDIDKLVGFILEELDTITAEEAEA